MALKEAALVVVPENLANSLNLNFPISKAAQLVNNWNDKSFSYVKLACKTAWLGPDQLRMKFTYFDFGTTGSQRAHTIAESLQSEYGLMTYLAESISVNL